MTYTAKLTALNKGLTSIHPEQDRINFAPQLNEDIRVLLEDGNSYLTFNKVRNDGTIWVVSDIEGWWNISEPSMPDIERGFGDGSFDVSGRFQSRILTLTGSVLITSGDRTTIGTTSASVRNELLSAFNLVKRGTWLIVDEDSYKRAAYVRLSGKPEINVVNSRGRIDFSIGLKAADPLKYEWVEDVDLSLVPSGETVDILNGYRFARTQVTSANSESMSYRYNGVDYNNSSSFDNTEDLYTFSYDYTGIDWFADGTSAADDAVARYFEPGIATSGTDITITNYGTSNVYCVFKVIGPLYGPAVIRNKTTNQEINILAPTSGNQILSPTNTELSKQYLQIDTYSRSIIKGDPVNGIYIGNYRSTVEPLLDWIYLAPGNNSIYFNDYGTQASTSFPALQVYWRSGWIG
jgi:hypothetical protein